MIKQLLNSIVAKCRDFSVSRRSTRLRQIIDLRATALPCGCVADTVFIFVLFFPADINEERGCNPQHLIHLSLRYAEARVDYMGTCILMGNLSAFKTDLHDEWTLQETTSPSTGKLFSPHVL